MRMSDFIIQIGNKNFMTTANKFMCKSGRNCFSTAINRPITHHIQDIHLLTLIFQNPTKQFIVKLRKYFPTNHFKKNWNDKHQGRPTNE